MKSKTNIDENKRYIEAGIYLFNLRKNINISLANVGKEIGVSANYIKDIEKNNKLPSNRIIRALAEFYRVDENELFIMYDKIPLSTLELLSENQHLAYALARLKTDKNVCDQERNKLISLLIEQCQSFLS